MAAVGRAPPLGDAADLGSPLSSSDGELPPLDELAMEDPAADSAAAALPAQQQQEQQQQEQQQEFIRTRPLHGAAEVPAASPDSGDVALFDGMMGAASEDGPLPALAADHHRHHGAASGTAAAAAAAAAPCPLLPPMPPSAQQHPNLHRAVSAPPPAGMAGGWTAQHHQQHQPRMSRAAGAGLLAPPQPPIDEAADPRLLRDQRGGNGSSGGNGAAAGPSSAKAAMALIGGDHMASPWAHVPSLSPTSSLHSALSNLSSLSLSLSHQAAHASGQHGASASATPPSAPSPPPLQAAAASFVAAAAAPLLPRSASASSLAPAGATLEPAGDELPPAGSGGAGPAELGAAQFVWEPRLEPAACHKPAPREVALDTPTSSDWDYYSAHKDDAMLFNVGLVADACEPRPVRLAAVDLARNSAWFQALTSARHALSGTEVESVVVPCRMQQCLLEAMVGALYASTIELGPDSVEGVYRAADAMQMPALMAACEHYLAATCFDDPEADPIWVNAVYDLACDLCRSEFAASLARHYACAAQRDAAGRRSVLAHVLSSPPYAGDGVAQMELLREGHHAAWNGQGPEVLLLNVMLEVADALSVDHLQEMLDKVEWATLQQEEVAALVDWVLGMPQSCPLTPLLKDRALQAVSAQISGHHQRRYLVWRADVGRLPGAGQRLMSSGALTIGARRLYLCMERAGPSEWGLFLCPPPDVSLYSRVAFHTLFVLGPDYKRRVAVHDVTIAKDLRVGAGFGSRTIVTEWMAQELFKPLADGSRHLCVGTIATSTPQ